MQIKIKAWSYLNRSVNCPESFVEKAEMFDVEETNVIKLMEERATRGIWATKTSPIYYNWWSAVFKTVLEKVWSLYHSSSSGG